MSTRTRFTEAEKVIFFAWLESNPQVAKTRANAQAFGDYLEGANLKATLKNLDAAYKDLRSGNLLELYKTPAEVEAEKVERVRHQIYTEVAAKIAPAQLNFSDWDGTLRPLSKYLYEHHGGRMSVDTLDEAILHLKLSLPWVVEPQGLAKNRRNETLGYGDSRTEHGVQGRRNHADDVVDRESTERTKKFQEKLKDDEARVIGKVLFEDSIEGYVAVRNGRISASQTEAVKKALRAYAAKHGSSVLALIRSMPDDETTEWYIKKRI